MRAVSISIVCAVVLAVDACASSSTTRAYVAPTRETVLAKLEAADGPEEAGHVVVENHSTVPITVTSVTLHRCENIKQECEISTHMDLKLDADSRKMVMRVQRKLSNQGYSVSYTFTWTADSNSTVALTALAQSGSKEAADRLAAIKHSEDIQRREVGFVDEELGTAAIVRLGDKIATLRADPDSIVIDRGSVLFVQQLRILAIGAQGEVLGRYRSRYSFHPQPGAIRFAPPDSLIGVTPGRSDVSVTAQTPEGSTRSTPLPTVHFTIIVR